MERFTKMNSEIKKAVLEGYYSIFETYDGMFVLITNHQKFYKLSDKGEIVEELNNGESLEFKRVICEEMPTLLGSGLIEGLTEVLEHEKGKRKLKTSKRKLKTSKRS